MSTGRRDRNRMHAEVGGEDVCVETNGADEEAKGVTRGRTSRAGQGGTLGDDRSDERLARR